MKKKFEITKKGKIIFSILGVIILGLIIYIIIPKNNIEGLSIEIAMPNEGILVDDPILGTSLELSVGKKIKLLETVYPKDVENKKIEYISENPEIAYVDNNNNIIGKSVGTTKIYLQTKNKKIKSNIIEITIVE